MEQSSENKGFSASDFERYHSGKMSASERHALEKAALDDPFLADALEGYAFTRQPEEELQQMRERIKEKLKDNRAVPLYTWLRAVAIFIVVGGTGWLLYNNLYINQNQEI